MDITTSFSENNNRRVTFYKETGSMSFDYSSELNPLSDSFYIERQLEAGKPIRLVKNSYVLTVYPEGILSHTIKEIK